MEVIVGINCECGAMMRDPWDGKRPPQGAVVVCPKCGRKHLPYGLSADALERDGMSRNDAQYVAAFAKKLLHGSGA